MALPPRRIDSTPLEANRGTQSIKLDIDLSETDQFAWDLEKGPKVRVEKASGAAAQDVHTIGKTTQIQFYSTKRTSDRYGQETIELVTKDGEGSMAPNHTWLSVLLSWNRGEMY